MHKALTPVVAADSPDTVGTGLQNHHCAKTWQLLLLTGMRLPDLVLPAIPHFEAHLIQVSSRCACARAKCPCTHNVRTCNLMNCFIPATYYTSSIAQLASSVHLVHPAPTIRSHHHTLTCRVQSPAAAAAALLLAWRSACNFGFQLLQIQIMSLTASIKIAACTLASPILVVRCEFTWHGGHALTLCTAA